MYYYENKAVSPDLEIKYKQQGLIFKFEKISA